MTLSLTDAGARLSYRGESRKLHIRYGDTIKQECHSFILD